MTRKPKPLKPFGPLGLSGEMPRKKTEDQVKIEKILLEEQDKERERAARKDLSEVQRSHNGD